MRNYLNKILAIVVILATLLNSPFQVFAASYTIGNTTNGANSASSSTSDFIRVSTFTASNTGVVTTGHARVNVSGNSSRTRLVVYSDSGGNPSTLLSVSDEITVTATSETLTDYVFTGANRILLVSGTPYWIGIHNEDAGVSNFVLSNQTGGGRRFSTDTYTDGTETTFTQSGTGTDAVDVWLDYEDQNGSTYPLVDSHLNDSGLQIDLDGVDERLTSVSDPSFSADTKSGGRTICMWFNLDSVPASEATRSLFVWSNSDAQGVWNFRIRTDRASVPWTGTRFELQTAADTGAGTGLSTFIYSSNQTFSTGTLYHLCLVSSGTAWSLYVNATSKTLTVSTTGSGGNDGDWWGDVAGSGTITFSAFGNSASSQDGRVDDLAYFDDDLTSAEITALYNGGKPIHPLAVGLTDLSGYWKLGESENGSVTTFYDSRGVMTDTFTGTNMENADIIPTSYY